MKLGIIAAGEGSRLKEEGISLPKPLVNVGGEPMIYRIIRNAKLNGFSSINCIINEHSEPLRDYLTNNDFGIPINLVIQSTQSSMHSLFVLAPLLAGEKFCLTTADSIFDEKEFSDFITNAVNDLTVDGTLAITRFIDDEKPLCLKMDKTNRIIEFSDDKQGFEWVTGGIYFFSPGIFKVMNQAIRSDISRLRNFLKLLINNGYILKGYPFSKIIDVDHVSDIRQAEVFLNIQS
ncbi:MAG: nucleotidyltransferase family protein [Bacillota bacterium]